MSAGVTGSTSATAEIVTDLMKVMGVGVTIQTCNKNVVQVDEDEVQVPEYAVHQPLKSLRRIFQTKWHAQKFKQAKWSDYCRLGNVCGVHGYLMVSTDEVNDRKDCRRRRNGTERVDVWQRVFVVLSGCIKPPEVSTRSPTTIWFWHHLIDLID